MDETFFGYCFLKVDGEHCPKVTLNGPQEVWNYVQLQKKIFPEVRITDTGDACVVQAINGKIVFPPQWAEMDEHLRNKQKESGNCDH